MITTCTYVLYSYVYSTCIKIRNYMRTICPCNTYMHCFTTLYLIQVGYVLAAIQVGAVGTSGPGQIECDNALRNIEVNVMYL